LRLNDFATTKKMAKSLVIRYPKDQSFIKTLIGLEVQSGNLDSALTHTQALVRIEANEANLELLASVHFVRKEYQEALSYLEQAYALHSSPEILDRLTSTLILFFNQKEQAQSYLALHIQLWGCNELLCERLASLYREKQNFTALESIYKRLYEQFGGKQHAQAWAEILIWKKEFIPALELVEKENLDENLALELYRVTAQFSKAKELAQKLYKEKQTPRYYGLMLLYEYESSEQKNDQSFLRSLDTRLTPLLETLHDDMFYNFLGYMLIDHSLDVQRGIALVNKALAMRADSPYYLDSLAWGYYRLNECSKANATLQKIPRSIIDGEPEIREHEEKIQECLSKQKRKP